MTKNTPDAICARCWDEDHIETPIQWVPGTTPRWCDHHLQLHLAQINATRTNEREVAPAASDPGAASVPVHDTANSTLMPHPRTWTVKKLLLTVLTSSLLVTSLLACGGLSSVTSEPSVTVTCVPAVAHSPQLWVQFDVQTLDYPAALGHQANVLMASWLQTVARPASGGLTFFDSLLNDDPLNPASTPLTLHVGPIPAYPASCPTPQPTSTACASNPYACVAPQQTTTANYQSAISQYQAQVRQVDAQVASTQQAVGQVADTLGKQQPVPYLSDHDTSVFGVLALASQRFAAQTGSRYLVLASTLINTAGDEDLVPDLRLDGVHVLVIFEVAPDASTLQRTNATWQTVFRQAGAADVHFFDIGASQTLAAPWL